MPQFLVPIISAIGAAAGGVTGAFMIMYAAEIAIAAVVIGGLAYSNAQKNKAQRQARDQYNASQVDRLVNVIATDAPRELVMGRVRKAGTVFYRGSTGKDSQDLYMAIALAGHEIDGIEGYYLNDEPVTIDANGYVQEEPYKITTRTSKQSPTSPTVFVAGTVQPYYDQTEWGTGALLGYNYQEDVVSYTVQIKPYLGAAGQVADPSLMAAFPADWTSANVVQGVAYLVVKLSYNETAFPSGAPNVTVKMRGAKLYDPRTGLTTFSENPALMMRHLMLHPSFGKSAIISAAEDARITAAANACDTATVYTVGGVAQASRALYRASIVLPFGAPAKSGLDDLAQAMGGSWAFAGGELHMRAGVYTAPVMALTEADLAVIVRDGASETQKPIGISIHRERAQKFNSVKATIWDDAQDYKQTPLTALTSSALVTRDGAELIQEVQLPAVGYAPQALHICGVMMRDARDALTVELPFKLRAYPLELFDTVTLTIARYGWNNKQFMILGRTWAADGSISLTMKETAAAITQMDAGFLAQGFAANTNLPKPWSVQRVGALTVTSGTAELIKQADGTIVSRMRVSWPQVTDKAVQQAGRVEVQYRRADSTGAWHSLIADGSDTQIVTEAVEDGVYYIVRARAKTSLAVGDWNTQVQHQVIGKQALPSNAAGFTATAGPTGITFAWNQSPDADYHLTQVRSGLTWATAQLLFSGAASNWTWIRPPANTYSFLVKHFDTSGLESATAATASMVYTEVAIDNAAAIAAAALDATAKANTAQAEAATDATTKANAAQAAAALDATAKANAAQAAAIAASQPVFVVDTTPPPTPTGLSITVGMGNYYISVDAAVYTQGRGHGFTVLYASSTSTFASAVEVTRFEGTLGNYSQAPGTAKYLWVKWLSRDGIVSTTAAGGASHTTGKIGNADLNPLIIEAGNLANNSVGATKLAVNAIAIGTAAIQDGAIVNAMLGNATIDSAKISNLNASKITAGNMQVGSYLRSTSYIPGSSGWTINADGTAELANATVRGSIYATAGYLQGVEVRNSAGVVLLNAGDTANDVRNSTLVPSIQAASVSDNLWTGSLATITGNLSGGVIASTGYTDPRGSPTGVVVRLPVNPSYVYYRVLNQSGRDPGWYNINLRLHVVAGMSIVVSATDGSSWNASEYKIATTTSVTPVWVGVSLRQYVGAGTGGLDVVIGSFHGPSGIVGSAPSFTEVAIADLFVYADGFVGASNATANQSDATTNAAIAAKLNNAGANVMNTGFFLQTNGYAGGNGVALYDGGLIAKQGGVNKFVVGSDGSATFAGTLATVSATSGERTEITNSVIRVYDASNVLRIKMGNLA